MVIGSNAIEGSVTDSSLVTRGKIKVECASATYQDDGRWEDKFWIELV